MSKASLVTVGSNSSGPGPGHHVEWNLAYGDDGQHPDA